jgi:hypothetical protein
MANDLTKRTGPTAPEQAEDAASRLKSDLMRDALGRILGEDGEKTVSGTRASSSRLPTIPEPPAGTAPRPCRMRCSSRQLAAAWR